MKNHKNRTYIIILLSCLIGYLWIYFLLTRENLSKESYSVCFIKNTIKIPCPSCGTSRSILLILKGEFSNALEINPLGFLSMLIMIVSPMWILFDYLTNKQSFFNLYSRIVESLKKSKYAIPFIILIIANWIWNIKKGL